MNFPFYPPSQPHLYFLRPQAGLSNLSVPAPPAFPPNASSGFPVDVNSSIPSNPSFRDTNPSLVSLNGQDQSGNSRFMTSPTVPPFLANSNFQANLPPPGIVEPKLGTPSKSSLSYDNYGTNQSAQISSYPPQTYISAESNAQFYQQSEQPSYYGSNPPPDPYSYQYPPPISQNPTSGSYSFQQGDQSYANEGQSTLSQNYQSNPSNYWPQQASTGQGDVDNKYMGSYTYGVPPPFGVEPQPMDMATPPQSPGKSNRNQVNSKFIGAEIDPDQPIVDFDRTVLDFFNSDLHLEINRDSYQAEALTNPSGFCFCWAGTRATYGVCSGKVCFEMRITELLTTDFGDDHQETDPHIVRVGWSMDKTSLQLGEEPDSFGYGGTGKFSTNSRFSNYGEKFNKNDVIMAMLDLESRPCKISFAKNGRWLGMASPLHGYKIGNTDQALFPHILTKNCRFEVNFGQRVPWFPPPIEGFTFIDHLSVQSRVRGSLPPKRKSDCEMIMIVGLPGAGKTTWALKMFKDHPEKCYNIIGTDTLIDKMKVMGLPRKNNYHGRWEVLIQKATSCLNKLFQIASRRRRNYILDQTNVYASARKRKMKHFLGFKRICAVLQPDDDELKRREWKRTFEDGKVVPEEAVLEMKLNYSLPDLYEDYVDEIMWIELEKESSSHLVKKYINEANERMPERAKAIQNPSSSSFQRDDYRKLSPWDNISNPKNTTMTGNDYVKSEYGAGGRVDDWTNQKTSNYDYNNDYISSGFTGGYNSTTASTYGNNTVQLSDSQRSSHSFGTTIKEETRDYENNDSYVNSSHQWNQDYSNWKDRPIKNESTSETYYSNTRVPSPYSFSTMIKNEPINPNLFKGNNSKIDEFSGGFNKPSSFGPPNKMSNATLSSFPSNLSVPPPGNQWNAPPPPPGSCQAQHASFSKETFPVSDKYSGDNWNDKLGISSDWNQRTSGSKIDWPEKSAPMDRRNRDYESSSPKTSDFARGGDNFNNRDKGNWPGEKEFGERRNVGNIKPLMDLGGFGSRDEADKSRDSQRSSRRSPPLRSQRDDFGRRSPDNNRWGDEEENKNSKERSLVRGGYNRSNNDRGGNSRGGNDQDSYYSRGGRQGNRENQNRRENNRDHDRRPSSRDKRETSRGRDRRENSPRNRRSDKNSPKERESRDKDRKDRYPSERSSSRTGDKKDNSQDRWPISSGKLGNTNSPKDSNILGSDDKSRKRSRWEIGNEKNNLTGLDTSINNDKIKKDITGVFTKSSDTSDIDSGSSAKLSLLGKLPEISNKSSVKPLSETVVDSKDAKPINNTGATIVSVTKPQSSIKEVGLLTKTSDNIGLIGNENVKSIQPSFDSIGSDMRPRGPGFFGFNSTGPRPRAQGNSNFMEPNFHTGSFRPQSLMGNMGSPLHQNSSGMGNHPNHFGGNRGPPPSLLRGFGGTQNRGMGPGPRGFQPPPQRWHQLQRGGGGGMYR